MSEENDAAWKVILAAGVFGGLFGSLLTVIFNHRLTLWRENRAAIQAEKSAFIPLIDGYMLGTSKGEGLGFIRHAAQEKLFQPAMRFRLKLKGKRLMLFNEAWGSFANTTQAEVGNAQPGDSAELIKKMQSTLMARLEALRLVVYES